MPTRALLFVVLSIFCASCARDSKSADAENNDGIAAKDSGTDTSSDGSDDMLVDGASRPAMGPAEGDQTWVDKDSDLEWDNRVMPNMMELDFGTAKTQCDELTLADHDDWRLPNIDELRSLVRNISPIMTGGACPTSEACPQSSKCNVKDEACLGCTAMKADLFKATDCKLSEAELASGLCYWPQGMNGPCSAYWSATSNPDLFGQASYYVRFSNGIIRSDFGGAGGHWVRCVRAAN